MAQSVVLLYSQDRRGIGKRTSDLVKPLADAAIALLDQPFIASRQPTAWQSVVTRSACATAFALMVVASAPADRRNELLVLNGYSIAHAFVLLRGPVPEQHPPRVFHELTTRAVHQMAFQEQPDDLRRSWARPNLSPTTRERWRFGRRQCSLKRTRCLPSTCSPGRPTAPFSQPAQRAIPPTAHCSRYRRRRLRRGEQDRSAFFIGGKVGRNLRRMPDRYGSICKCCQDARGRCQRRRS